MGQCGTKLTAEEKAQIAASKAIDKQNKNAYKAEMEKVKLLLLGAGESGKSTIFKQMRILYGAHHGFPTEERQRFAPTVYGNILTNFKTVLENADEYGPIESPELKGKINYCLGLDDGKGADVTPDLGNLIKAFWADPGFQKIWSMRSHFQVQDALAYYCTEIDRIAAPDYIPTSQDILRARVRTSGIVEEVYNIDGVTFVMFDVGGQRNERKKWIHCFDDVTAVIFVAAINEYDQVLYEDQTMNRMDEAVILFDEICNSPHFKTTSMILFLNKKDLFREKLAQVPFRIDEDPNDPYSEPRYTDFAGPHVQPLTKSAQPGTPEFEECFEAAKRYILQLFLNRNKNKGKEIYHHVTCATDTDNVEVVFNASKDIILQQNLRGSGFVVM
mmetsp:Transcript_21643/g.38217  ORF Transcript_21643/g.38217 Transcript_21643/m.38217 type:complete len:387 (-) Transcript_21643:165-1325(-)